MLGVAIAYNLKKWINFKVKKVNVKIEALPKPLKKDNWALENIFSSILRHAIFLTKQFALKSSIA
jgi:hypothetical protein